MVTMALRKDSALPVRMAALGAIALMILTIIICLIFIFNKETVIIDPSVLIVGAPPVENKPVEKGSSMIMILFILFLLVLFGVIAYLSMKEHKKSKPKGQSSPPVSSW